MLIIQRPEVEVGEAEGNTQTFVISPLEPGFGHTLGNSLRRTLLSSIPGAAVTRIRFDEALHEFDTIKGVKEDVTDLILNVKDLVLRCTSEEAVTLRLDARGPGDVTAGDIQVDLRHRDAEPAARDRVGERRRPARPRPHGRAGPRLPVGGAGQEGGHRPDRHHPRRRDLLAGAPGRVQRHADPRRAGHQLRPAHDRDRDRRFDHAARRARVGRRHAAQPRRPHRRPLRRAAGPRARRDLADDGDVARPRAARSRSSTSRSARATASSGPASTRSASSCRRPRTTCSRSRTSVRSRSRKSCRSSTSGVSRCGSRSRRCPVRRRVPASAARPRTTG